MKGNFNIGNYGSNGILLKFRRPLSAKIFRKHDIGERMLTAKADVTKDEKEYEIQKVLEGAEHRATRELRAAVKRIVVEKDEEKRRALDKQKEYFDRLAKRIEFQRDEAEEERFRELRKKLQVEKEEALQQQWVECEKIKEKAVEDACIALERKLRAEFAVQKEKDITEALRKQKEKLKKEEKENIKRTIKECEEKARIEAERVAKLHEKEIERLNQRYDNLKRKYFKELDHKKRVEEDFRALQEDYRKFMDYTDGKFHSDYLMRLRHLGMRLAEKRLSQVNYNDIPEDPPDQPQRDIA
ncbi:hypothetical protein KUTeg_012235 [Tegillarca granosa]|uniref:Trichohyalin-plectin-homology domain-containing protein n=1 Tax=Tegillarca granosa TaxID=220873 RepID=A0ABQ9EYY5_TEGGR|nr:hypothetical protein KUTeg_012235 [Tegillarca granosa]